MNSLIQLKTRTLLLLVSMLGCFTLLPKAQAVTGQDGNYGPNNSNTAEGFQSLNNLNPANGGQFNTAVGLNALFTNTAGTSNTAVGVSALRLNTSSNNTAVGVNGLNNNSTGTFNTAVGVNALFTNTVGNRNTAVGVSALRINTSGSNTAVGIDALNFNSSGHNNTAVGDSALLHNTGGSFNTALGSGALLNKTGGSSNVAVGANALSHAFTQNFNVALGTSALLQSTGGSNTAVGTAAGFNVTTASGVISIGSFGANVNNSCFIGHIRNVQTANANAIPVVIDSAGQLGTVSSSRRFKKEIKPIDQTSEAILGLKPVTFHYKSDSTGTPQFGLIAEDVAKVNPDLVVRDDNGEIYSVRYDAVNAMLLNEFLKAHRKMEEQAAMIAKQQKQIEALTAGLQRVSAQVEMSRPAPQLVENHQ
jgi:hypothetical protein